MKRFLHIGLFLSIYILISPSFLGAQTITTDNYFVSDVTAISGEQGKIWIGTSKKGIIERNSEGKIINTYNQSGSGLIDDHINCISVDNRNNKWIGTDQGISIFDGFEWQTITRDDGISSNKIKTIVFTEDNLAYIGTDKGVDIYDISAQKVIKSLRERDGLANNIVTSLAVDSENTLWIGSIGGVNMYDGEHVSELHAPDSISLTWINSIAANGKNIWIGSDKGLTYYDGDSYNFFDKNHKLLSNEIKDISTVNDSVWIATDNAITLYTNGAFKHFQKSNSELLFNNYKIIWTNDNGNTWAGNYKGISKYSSGNWSNYRELEGNNIHNSTIYENTIWFSTNNGLTIYNHRNWETYTIKDGLIDNIVNDISIDKEKEIWIATESGITHINGNTTNSYTANDGLIDNNVKHTAIDSSNNKWFGTSSGISVYDGKKWINITAGEEKIESNNITDIATDPGGVVWISTTNGVSSFDNGRFSHYSSQDGLVSDSVNTVFIDSSGKKWFGTQKGISIYNGDKWTGITPKDNLPFTEVTALAESSNNTLLIGGNKGVALYENDTFRLVNKQCGLICNKVHSISCFNEKTWVATNKGLTKMESFINHAPGNISFKHQTIDETYPAESTITKLSAEDPDPEDQHKFSLIDGVEDNDLFTVSKDKLIIHEATDFEKKQAYNLTIKTKDEYGKSYTKELTLPVTNIAPKFEKNSFTIRENRKKDYKIGKLALDKNKDTNSVNFEIIAGNTNDAFHIDSAKGTVRVNKPSMMDYESCQDFSLKTLVTDGKYSDTTNVKIQLEDVLNEGFNVLFTVENTSGEYIENAEVTLNNYGTLITLSNGLVIYGSVQPYTDITYTVAATGYKSDTGAVHIKNQNIEKHVVLDREKSKEDEEETDTVSTAVKHNQPKKINLYPNPVVNKFYIKGHNITNKQLAIKNMNGSTVLKTYIAKNNDRISVENLSSGIYIVEIKGEKNAIRRKIMIK
jgi:ligand-binding sensor domain-containing protein